MTYTTKFNVQRVVGHVIYGFQQVKSSKTQDLVVKIRQIHSRFSRYQPNS